MMKEPPYFRSGHLNDPTPKNFAEARLQLMWLAGEARANRAISEVDMASANLTFPMMTISGELTKLGAAMIAAVGAGVRLRLIFPNPERFVPTDAATSARAFKNEAFSLCETGKFPKALITVWGSAKDAAADRNSIVSRIDHNLVCVPIDLTASKMTSHGEGFAEWPGAFLSPVCRFTRIKTQLSNGTMPRENLFLIPQVADVGDADRRVAPDLSRLFALAMDGHGKKLYANWADLAERMSSL